MNTIDEKINALVEAVLESEQYLHYQEIRRKLKEDPQKEQRVLEFCGRVFRLQNEQKGIDIFAEIDKLVQETASFRAEPLVEDYLAAEHEVCRLVQRINWSLVEQLDVDLGKGV
ncbi:MAG: YlbF family regulator [Lachnospiraceae bacterium]|nr:YlbF family regulator [Lachnospiraceae bacterium]MCI9149503.1 YlbF family regulator [Lachnospiraceae bacterium]